MADSTPYIVKKGDTLWDISKKFLGDPFKWPTIYEYNNKSEIVAKTGMRIANPDLIFVNQEIAASSRCRMHIVHLSSQRGMQLVREARAEQIPLTAETCPHYLNFTQKDFTREDISVYLKTAPPVKHEQDRQALWEGLNDGTLSFITTDHAGCIPEQEKSSDNFWEIYGGIPGVQHRVSFMLSEGFKKGRLTLQKTIELLSTNVAEYFGIANRKGSLGIGKDADFVVMDLWKSQKITAADMQSKGKYTPFEGMIFDATVEQTWLRGKLISQHGQPVNLDYSYGRWLKRN